MAQFDVHENIGRHKAGIPFVVTVQSSQFDNYRRRVVIPLVRVTELGPRRFEAFNPAFTVRGIEVVLHTLEIVSISLDQLGVCVGSLADSGQEIMAALDELLTRAWE